MQANKPRTMEKVLTTLFLSLLAVGLYLVWPTPPRMWCAIAMLLSSLGDVALMGRVPGTDRTPPPLFALGAAFFMAAHLGYAMAYRLSSIAAGVPLPRPGTAAVFLLPAAVCAAFVILWCLCGRPGLAALFAVYLSVIGLNCTAVCTYAFGVGGLHMLAALGAAAFLLSDLLIGLKVLGVDKLRGPQARLAVWTLYPLGQLLLILFVG